jgi:hypothetical protein
MQRALFSPEKRRVLDFKKTEEALLVFDSVISEHVS